MSNKNKKSGGAGNGAAQKQTRQQSHDSQDYSSFKTVLFYCMLIVFLPVVTFFVLKGFVLDQFFSLTEVKVNIASAVGAVVSLHIALGLYIYRAYFGAPGSKVVKED
ncbi:vacuolar ATPase assembly integral membrane protein VMA21 homolog [Drosophila bipectinata]|uniref:vacuolar ATPase assembly integral membrane protein VMA21 homolog n=1 Tax=Drosophila bipectinata TaxID=42026 RepID=UPI001C8A575A|nr:vacuolar ATPase assembly integral membrane protein VMA21 homolog [Drosophila bipectinata]